MKNFFLLCTLIYSNLAIAATFEVGTYVSVSETSYSAEILFKENGACSYKRILFPDEPGESEDVYTEICNWKFHESIIAIESKNNKKSYYQFVPKLSGLPHGSNSFYPGIIPLSGDFISDSEYMWKKQ